MMFAQVDTVPVLKYELDSTYVEPPPVTESAEDSVSIVQSTEAEPEYFLRKEFAQRVADSIALRQLPDSLKQRLRQDDAFWYANESFQKKKREKESSGWFASSAFQTLMWILIVAGFATFLIVYLYNSNAGIFRSSETIGGQESDVEPADIFSINFQKEIDRAMAAGDYRLAVRMMFLRVLKTLSDRQIIQYSQDNTNLDYLLQLRSTAYYPEFFRITRNYEYSWYGQFDLSREKFDFIKKEFDQFDRRLY
jgi:hypothetical protein